MRIGLLAAGIGLAITASARYLVAPAQLEVYQGTWKVSRAGVQQVDQLKNDCKLFSDFFACQQTVNGAPSALLVIVMTKNPGHYFTQSVNTEGRGLGRGELEISGNRWVFSSRWDQVGKTTYYRTINTFSDRDHIHFEQQESSNGTDWKTTSAGADVRVGR
jgi:hypothetical protein